MARKDNRGRNLKDGESQRSDGRYMFRYADPLSAKRKCVYAPNLADLREKEKEIRSDITNGVMTDAAAKKITLNDYFEKYLQTRELRMTSRRIYSSAWRTHIHDTLGAKPIRAVRRTDIMAFYTELSSQGYARHTIHRIHTCIFSAMDTAMKDNVILRNPAYGAYQGQGSQPKSKHVLTESQQKRLLDFCRSGKFSFYHALLEFGFATGLRVGEIRGLTWPDVDTEEGIIRISGQLVYADYGDGARFHYSATKTAAGLRTIPLTEKLRQVLREQRETLKKKGIGDGPSVDGKSGFIFLSSRGNLLRTYTLDRVLKRLVDTYNDEEKRKALQEARKPELLPHLSSHCMRHTNCTRMAEKGVDPKVMQSLLGHSQIAMTMDVYNHINGMERIDRERGKLETLI